MSRISCYQLFSLFPNPLVCFLSFIALFLLITSGLCISNKLVDHFWIVFAETRLSGSSSFSTLYKIFPFFFFFLIKENLLPNCKPLFTLAYFNPKLVTLWHTLRMIALFKHPENIYRIVKFRQLKRRGCEAHLS